ncbi:purine-binding chemotaxis protein CheW [Pseudoalteromonas sp. SCSIO 43201]|uniref:Chemotaxis protein CheW n=1 Tax=Pseudoalteromonas peptidolytica F12-50-A1 TaxID=1315280 RepID=A0A8I0MZF9_9GAMM|nr:MULTISPECIES: chemotaxis protein CheW [Pseudoalteromonas]MBE0347804.1 purine-binding chemotaxis protein CheW [Pseudoalteromonas peptidolytica F12-50-A1]MDW7551453.1 chemotaxis protein CheW [Pseudoalteromonas peptidolytica]NLR17174.1 purine-binding chemotaxis protein CheW [Pseudoalteromonas peptidolytica]USD28843.1 purine-binding chemotaxis protein CheW [Pseudoalteromonas sp. SCSIO 43201]GEK10698.1 chemotaxis protein CheW [Pseudoalteromonas peptidolytica]
MITERAAVNEQIMLANKEGDKQFLTFMMAGEEYGMDILAVQEIRGWEEVTAIPNSPRYVNGAINLRGTIVPIIDLRIRFGLPQIEYGALTVVIVVSVLIKGMQKIMGLVVDAVSDVYSINEETAKDVPDFQDSENSQFVQGLVNVGEKMVVLLNLKKILDLEVKHDEQSVVGG